MAPNMPSGIVSVSCVGGHGIGQEKRTLVSLVQPIKDGRHVGLDFYDPLIEGD